MSAIRGRTPGSENYSKEDVHILLNEIENIQPSGAKNNEWDAVLGNYQIYAERESRVLRDVTSIKKKLQSLLNSTKPTGKPSCPDSVRRARQIQRVLEERVGHEANLDDGEDSEDNGPAPGGHR
ncbi:hypothetical protein PPTG_17800 [Phytophthora nicotianae INRA-310]|uniref:DUF6818 domain-containing protein n=2 Tax=Phytophthora nicotianae TaxID=4792 RepID=W2PKK7_PHYN3|nr:hypothetical protein PPTG_17800 [Phytophthora nicotianae INRA-310]ETN00575.1 hypothetical protein PPTG_17800 [Phytophthora nicotianae INRA-310]ETO62055.1 hypothetical protein F444_19999 [Phytophthora nicotianae P1976]